MRRQIIYLIFALVASCGGGPEYTKDYSYTEGELVSKNAKQGAEKDSGNSVSTSTKSADYVPVSEPRALTVKTKTPTSISLEWQAPVRGIVGGYKLSYYDSANPPLNCDLGSTVGIGIIGVQTNFTLMGLEPKTNYSFRVCSVGQGGEVNIGAVISARTMDLPPNELLGLYLVQPNLNKAEIQASWMGSAGLENYRIAYVKGSINPPASCNDGISQVVVANNFMISGLSANEWIAVRVCSLNNNVPAELSAGLTKTIFVHSPAPSSVSSLQLASKDTTSLSFHWSPSSGSVGSYVVAYSETGYPISCEAGSVQKTATNSITILGLRPQTKVYAVVCAENIDSIPLRSSGVTITATTDALPIPPVAGLTCPTSPSTTVTWTHSSMDGYYISVSSPTAPAASCISYPQIFSRTAQQSIPPFGMYVIKVCAFMDGNPNTISETREIQCSY